MRVLITGSAGAIGQNLVNGMKERHQIRGLDRVPTPGLDDDLVGDITDFDLVSEATKDMDAVIHLVNVGGQWEQALQSMIGTYNVFECAAQNGARRIAYASRAGLLPQSFYPRTIQRTMDMMPRPDSYYSVTKVFGENLGYMYSARHDMEVVCVRIGNFNRDRDQPAHPHQLSHGDCVQVFEQAITHPGVRYEVVFGVSDSDWALYDLEHGRKGIGYDPQDRSVVPEDERK
jgi:nucleoside-diphosphate-sugar epimerase